MHSTGSCLSHCLTSEESVSTATFGCIASLGTFDRVDLFFKVSCFYSECIYLFHLWLYLLYKLLKYYSFLPPIIIKAKFVSSFDFFKACFKGN